MNLFILLIITIFGYTLCESNETIRVYNSTNKDVYVTTAYYRPFLKRIDADFPVHDVQTIKKNESITIEKPQKMGFLINDIILIATFQKNDFSFLERIADEQKSLKVVFQKIEERKKDVSLWKRRSDNEMKILNNSKAEVKKKLQKLEEESKGNITKVSIFTITNNPMYIITEGANNIPIIMDTKNIQYESKKDTAVKNEEENIKQINPEPKNKPLEKSENENNKAKKIIIQNPIKTPAVSGKKIESEAIPHHKKVLPEIDIESLSEHQKNEPITNTKEKKQEPTKGKLGFLGKIWSTIARFRAATTSWIINGTGKDLYIKQIYTQALKTIPTTIEDYEIVKNNDSLELSPLGIKILQWRYLLYKNPDDTAWKSLWMWPVWDAYTFGENNKIYKNSFATNQALVTTDITVKGDVYVAVYKYTKNKGAIRVTPIITISISETPQKVPYISNFEQFGYRQLVISNNKSSLSVHIAEDAYKNFIKKNIPLSLKQPRFFIMQSKENKLQLFDNNTWNNRLKNLKEAANPIQLDWIDKLLETRIERGTALFKEKFNL